MRRRGLVVLAAVCIVMLVLAAGLPWWLGLALRTAGGGFGVTFTRYERIGYSRFALHGVAVRRDGVTVTIDRVEAGTPLVWWWRHVRGRDAPVNGGRWSVVVEKRTRPKPPTPGGWVPLRAQLQRIAAELRRWLPEATVAAGTVRWPHGELTVQSARWSVDRLDARGLRFRRFGADVALVFAREGDVLTVTANGNANDVRIALESRGPAVAGTLAGWMQTAELHARFNATGWMPAEASMRADRLAIEGARLQLGNAYLRIRGHADIEWSADHFAADIALHGDPVKERSVPPLDVTMRGRGDAQSFTVETLHAAASGIVADLSAPVTVDRTGQIRGRGARFTMRAELARQPWFPVQGIVDGEARVVLADGQAPVVDFQLAAESVVGRGMAVAEAAMSGRFDWPRVRIEEARVRGAAGDELRGRADWDFHDQRLTDATVTGTLRRPTLGRLLPARLQFDAVTIDGRAAGTLPELNHEGRLQVRAIQFGRIKPADVAVTWRGRGPELESFTADAVFGPTRVAAAGSLDRSGATLTRFEFRNAGETRLQLTRTIRIGWRPALVIRELHLAGPDAAVDADLVWGEAGKAELAVRGTHAEWIASVAPLRGPAWLVTSATMTAAWERGPMTYAFAGGVRVDFGQGRLTAVDASVRGAADGVRIEALHVMESGDPVVNASGRLPVTLTPGGGRLVNVDPAGALVLDAETVPNAVFWRQIAATTGLDLLDPQMRIHLAGTWAQPRGDILFRATRAAMDPERFAHPLPAFEGIDVLMTGDSRGVRVDRFAFTIEGQAVRASGRLPIAESGWGELARDPVGFLRRGGEFRLEVPSAKVAMFSRFLPAALAPAGRLQADVRFERGKLGGYLRLRDAASRPLGPLGVLQQVDADIVFSDQQVTLERVTATTGGEPVTLTGTVRLPMTGWQAEKTSEPRYDVALRGRNLPFVRQSGLLVRGDLDLKLQSPPSGAPRISGDVRLRDSLFLADVRAFLPQGGGASAARRPPYFSIETPPLSAWELDVDVAGARFLRLRTPVFAGVASARFHLGGTLREPRAIGAATVDEGEVLMPFATFDVQQAAVRLTEEDPFEPTIYLRGTGCHWGYDLAMEISGKASSPDITFTSIPALDTEQVLLMVMTGAAPAAEVDTSVAHRAVQIGAFFGRSVARSLMGADAEPDRLSIAFGQKVSRQGRDTYEIEYKLGNRWALTGEYDEFDEYNVGFKWRAAPKREPR